MRQDYGGGYIPPEERFKNMNARFEQITTRGDGTLELGEQFKREDIDFDSALEHIKIHQEGAVAGSQFNGEMIRDGSDLKYLIQQALPEKLQYDQHGRAELTIDVESDMPIGWSGVKSLEEIKGSFPEATIEQRARIPGGEEATEDGVEGAWYPETTRNAQGGFEVAKDDAGNIKNPHGKFEPRANIVVVKKDQFREISKTEKLTVIISKDQRSNRPRVLTMFPGENAPAYPTKIDTESFKASSLRDTNEERFWKEHAFIQAE